MRWPEHLAKFAYEGVTHAGVLLVDRGSGQMLLAQRAYDETDDPEVQETWEMPGGSLSDGEDPQAGAWREFTEEVGLPVPDHEVVHGWRAGPERNYQGFVVAVDRFDLDSAEPDPDEVQSLGWFTPEEATTLSLRPEFAANDLEALVEYATVSGNDEAEEPEIEALDLVPVPVPVHGVVAPEEAASGDSRGFLEGAMTSRPLRIPLLWQKSTQPGHDGAVVVGSVDRIMRSGGLIHWEGLLMATPEADEVTDLIEFFGRFGVSVDGDKGSLNEEASKERNGSWYDAVRASGLTIVAIPAFAEAYISLGPHPDMPEEPDEADEADETDTEDAALVAGAMSPELLAFKRGKGWVTNPKETSRLHRYWTQKGQPGYAKVKWGTPGDWRRARALIGEKIAKNSPEKLRYLNQIISQWHYDALGYWPGELGKPGNPPDTKENRRRAARHAASADTIEASEETSEEASEEDSEESLARAHEESAKINAEAAEAGWEPVLVSSAGTRVLPPSSYFTRHPDTGALVIEDPDENGIRRTYGYAGEWGVCHIGFDGRCVEVPLDPTGGSYAEFHLGRTRVSDGEPLNTGLITYKIEHRSGQRILSETAAQQHFDNIAHAWAAVRLGEDERGVWFSGVVLPHVPEEDLTLIEAAGQVSGEWKYGALRSLLAVSVPGFPVTRASATYDESGEVESLVASIGSRLDEAPCTEAEPTPAERMAALAQIDAQTRFDAIRERFQKRGA